MKRIGWFFALSLMVGCAAETTEPTPLADTSVELSSAADRVAWEAAPPGCEDVAGEGLRLIGCEGETELGCVVDGAGDVLCVDSLDLLMEEIEPLDLRRFNSDPSPQPSVVAHRASLRPRDPTPTPIVRAHRADPTPTPMTEPDTDPEHDPTPTPMVER
jgi:cell division septation protein DedD